MDYLDDLISETNSRIKDIEIQIASLRDQGIEPTELEKLKNDYQAAEQNYYEMAQKVAEFNAERLRFWEEFEKEKEKEEEKEEKEAEKRKKKTMIWGFVILALFLCFMCSSFKITEKAYNAGHAYGKYRCTRCDSYETHGFYTFWYNDGSLCTGDKEYCLTHADYSIFSCDHCGNSFKVTRTQWQK